jgi:hypothetical protein
LAGRGMNVGVVRSQSLFPVPCFNLLRLFVVRVLAAGVAELRELKSARGRLLVLRRRVVPVLAHRTLQGDNFAHCLLLLSWPATSAGKQRGVWHAATQGLFAPSANPELSYGKRCGQATHNLLHYPTKSEFAEALRPKLLKMTIWRQRLPSIL